MIFPIENMPLPLQLMSRLIPSRYLVHALRGKEHVEYDNPFDVGMTGLIGFSSGYAAMKACDTLLLLGCDFPYRQFYPEGATVAQVMTPPVDAVDQCLEWVEWYDSEIIPNFR